MAHRVFWANKNLAHKGRATGLIFGFIKQLAALHKKWPDHFRVVAWDAKGGSARRVAESKAGVERGIIAKYYKQERREQQKTPEKEAELESLFEQTDQVQDGLRLTRTLQVKIDGVEGDDILYSYAKWAERHGGEAVIVSTDQDFYQAMSDKVSIYDAMKKEMWTPERFELVFGFSHELWVDAGAIMGDKSDTIIGVDKWGPKTTYKYVQEYGGIQAIWDVLTEKDKPSKTEQRFLDSDVRLELARSLKQMDEVPGLPRTRVLHVPDPKAVEAFLLRFGIASMLKDVWRFT
jgi:DNA polymerase-1